ncbi:pirin family protein [Salinimicrobium tongyeongense]|uniref:Pirin family protein n=1 Tax=Salinimicrobium tongyeongense TaxID=2809707 RepID=A0ABY6NQ34_9FLAO|nr:pirin family protein [Salinimicrobium tongyeongense]UZH54678.1 pirin family protein [Salinimicrobium tongyeongense]
MRTIKRTYKAEYRPIADLITYSPMPTRSLRMIDPFLFLNHHGPQRYSPGNNGLPFGPHPHRGMETVTFILDGDIAHKDSGGNNSVIESGGVQWMTAGKGLIHAEVSSEKFKKEGGPLEILQLWVNLPAKLKMTPPTYKGLQKGEIPVTFSEDKKVKAQVISGDLYGTKGPFDTPTEIHLSTLFFEPEGVFSTRVPAEHNILCYVIKGEIKINGEIIQSLHLVEFNNDDENLRMEALAESIVLFGHAKPFNEPVVAQGPFVMNTLEEIDQAYTDYQQGKFE